MGLRSDDETPGERPLLRELSNYAKPLISPDGETVVFSNRLEGKAYAIDWEGRGPRPLGNGFALELWRDPETHVTWVYVGTDRSDRDAYQTVERFRLDDPSVRETVLENVLVADDNFQLSDDGLKASGVFPWPVCGVLDVAKRELIQLGFGCWTSLAPGLSYVASYLDNSHRVLHLTSLPDKRRWNIDLGTAPGIDGHRVYHPRWSNTTRLMTMTGPYVHGEGGDAIRAGGEQVEIYVGRFDAELRDIERWRRATDNRSADYFPELWVAPGSEDPVGSHAPPTAAPQ